MSTDELEETTVSEQKKEQTHRIRESEKCSDGFHARCSCTWRDPNGVSVMLVHAAWEQHWLDMNP